jgi:hypothetical protein
MQVTPETVVPAAVVVLAEVAVTAPPLVLEVPELRDALAVITVLREVPVMLELELHLAAQEAPVILAPLVQQATMVLLAQAQQVAARVTPEH